MALFNNKNFGSDTLGPSSYDRQNVITVVDQLNTQARSVHTEPKASMLVTYRQTWDKLKKPVFAPERGTAKSLADHLPTIQTTTADYSKGRTNRYFDENVRLMQQKQEQMRTADTVMKTLA